MQASDDLGIEHPWTTIASKTGSSAWTGYGTAALGTPADGKVYVSVADIELECIAPHRFLRMKVTVP